VNEINAKNWERKTFKPKVPNLKSAWFVHRDPKESKEIKESKANKESKAQ